jgi:plastocyanin
MFIQLSTKIAAISAVAVVVATNSFAWAQTAPTIAGCDAQNFVEGAEAVQVVTKGSSYYPRCLKVKVGSTVSIQATRRHPLEAMADIGGAGNPFGDSRSFEVTQTRLMEQPGVFGYFCTDHGDASGEGMAGIIWVVE